MSEVLVSYEAGYRRLITKQFSVDLTAFRNNYNHLSSVEAGDAYYDDAGPYPHMVYPFVNGNGVRGSTSGFELIAGLRVGQLVGGFDPLMPICIWI